MQQMISRSILNKNILAFIKHNRRRLDDRQVVESMQP